MRLWLGVVTIVAGVVLWFSARREHAAVPPWVPRLAIAISTLGAGTVAATRPGVYWSVASSALSLVAIIIIATVLRQIVRRR